MHERNIDPIIINRLLAVSRQYLLSPQQYDGAAATVEIEGGGYMTRKANTHTHSVKTHVLHKRKPSALAVEPAAAESSPFHIVARPDGYHWLTPDDKQEFGPFETIEQAQADIEAIDERAPVSDLTLQEAEREIGIADWIDAETGEPAEGACPPHLEEK